MTAADYTPAEAAALALLDDDMRRFITDPRLSLTVPARLRSGIPLRQFARLPVVTRVRILLARQLLEETVPALRPRRAAPPLEDANGRPAEPLPVSVPDPE